MANTKSIYRKQVVAEVNAVPEEYLPLLLQMIRTYRQSVDLKPATESFRKGSIVEWPAELTSRTIADGLRTQSVGTRNFAHIQAFVDGILTVSEAEIRAAMRAIVATTRLVPEPSGAVSAAALLFHAAQLPSYRKAVAVVSGGNVAPALLAEVLTETGS